MFKLYSGTILLITYNFKKIGELFLLSIILFSGTNLLITYNFKKNRSTLSIKHYFIYAKLKIE